ncbi:imidazolonepropionase [Acidaminobacterium chupaoyuni]
MQRLLVKNIGLLCTPVGSHPHAGPHQGAVEKTTDACVLIEDGKIVYAGSRLGLHHDISGAKIIDAMGKVVTPGLIDAHTHLVFGGWRQNEIPLKLAGASYLDILKNGGGILSTVRHTREESAGKLYAKSIDFLDEMLALGITACEIKSGYGLDLENEIKQLEVIERLSEDHPMDIVATYLGAHAVPEEYKGRSADYLRLITEEVMPVVAQRKLAKYCDVFCETGVFDPAESKLVLECGKQHGLIPKIHADEIDAIGGAQLSAEVGAVSAEHLIATNEEGMQAMAKGGVIADLLPATSFYLGKTFAPARRMIELEIPVVIASDFNPGSCPSLNLQLAMNLGYLRYRMTPEEILCAVTINAACSIGLEKVSGSLEPGKQADLVIWDAPDLEMLLYRFGSNQVDTVIKNGEIVIR